MVARQADAAQPMSLSSTELRPANVIMGPRHTLPTGWQLVCLPVVA